MRQIRAENFSLFTTWRDIKKNIVCILLAAFVGFSASRLYATYFEENIYSSSMVLAVNIGGYSSYATYGSLTDTIQIATVVDNVFRSEVIKDVIAEETGHAFNAYIEAQQVENTNFVAVLCKAKDPKSSYQALLDLNAGYQALTKDLFGNVVLTVVKSPTVSYQKANRYEDFIHEIEYSLFAAAAAVIVIVLLSYFRDTVKNESDIETLLDSELFETVYTEKLKNKDKRPLKISDNNVGYLFNYSFNKMSVKLESLKRTRDTSSILITSVFENEGKTTVSSNLAIALAEDGKKVVLIDSDFKNPSVYKMFPEIDKNTKNLVEYIKGEATLEEVIAHDKSTKVDIICNLKSQRKSTEYLREESFKDMILQLEGMYDFVIIDSPPVGLVSDTEILKDYVSSVLFVVAQDYTEVGAITDAMENFEEEKILGCVFNRVGQFKRQLKDKYIESV